MVKYYQTLLNKLYAMRKSVFVLGLFSFFSFCSFSQNDQLDVNGYIKYLPSISFSGNDNLTTNLIHNRINVKSYLNDYTTVKIDFRNRIFFGDVVDRDPNLSEMLDIDNGSLDMSFIIIEDNSLVIHSIIDRAYIDYAKDKWEIRLGRQRINWGINLAWNSNDLFNAYSFVDFDYEERPGTDAVRFQYYTGDFASFDFACKFGENADDMVLGGMYKFNKWKYDLQLLVANYYTDYAIGGGWAGNLKDAGFKGEATYFRSKKNMKDTTGVISASSSVDYSFKNGIYLNGSVLYNSNGSDEFDNEMVQLMSASSEHLTAKSLMPTKYSYFVQANKMFNPMISASMAVIYGQGMDILFFMPSVSYSIKENWDLNLTSQSFFLKSDNEFDSLENSIFCRLRWSF